MQQPTTARKVMVIELFKFGKRRRNSKEKDVGSPALQTASRSLNHPFGRITSYTPLSRGNEELYRSLRESIPIIDAALDKLVRLMGDFHVECKDIDVEKQIGEFLLDVRAGGSSRGIQSFLTAYTNQLLTYGTAVGEIVLTGNGRDIYSLINVPLKNVELGYDKNMIDVLVYPSGVIGGDKPFPYQQLITVSALNPEPGEPSGISLLQGLPFVSEILLKIYNTIGVNWERVGNIRFAVTYKPSGEGDRGLSRSRASQIAEEWSKAMRDTKTVSDFVSVGDVSVKVIGADNQVLESEVPVRQMLEQIVSKLSVPPFMLGLSWSTTERMSSQQADILTSEIECYRRLVTPVIRRIISVWEQLHGIDEPFSVVWDNINLQDEVELARARLYNAQAQRIEAENSENTQ